MSVLWIIGEAKSGKSELAEKIFTHLPGKKFYIGTLPRTPRWMETIKKHAARRPKSWKLIEIMNSMDVATKIIEESSKSETVSVLLDGWGVYLERRASKWGKENIGLTLNDEKAFVEQMYEEYRRLLSVCDYLIIVEHIKYTPPTREDYEADPITWRVRAVVSRCLAEADKIIYHDKLDVSHKDEEFVKQVANEMIMHSNTRIQH